ncbi:hypothetical protein LAZ67_13001597 [Cordylochernes scorpioides]|uniref:Pentatricopeptide repeat-containing protein n=1 Tax=Cordylochernes scorpioides TaxID=51811 RepID=A0ABY6L4E6_9ARAC|nr:hypothetical protein LAZ67_13001597 [Cordylochernes scorpioides]
MRTTEKINITRCHRVSRKPGAPILVEVPEQNDRTTLFKAAFNLRGTKISLSKDYSMKMREQRRVLNVKRRELVEKERGSSVLDYFMYTHGLTQIISDMWIEELSYSDHLPIVLQINTGYEAIKSSYKNEILTRKFIWTKENVEMLKHNLSDIEVGNETDINTETANFTKQIYTAMESANIIKFAKRRHQLSKPWYDKDCYIMKKTTKGQLGNGGREEQSAHKRLLEALDKMQENPATEELVALIIEEGNSAEKLPRVVSIIYNFGKKNFINAEKCGCICEALDCFQAQNVKFRTLFLNQLQEDFLTNPHKHENQPELLKALGLRIIEENSSLFDITIYTDGISVLWYGSERAKGFAADRNNLIKDDPMDFLNIVNLHFEAFYHMKVNRTVPLKVLVPAILSYCELILEYPTDASISLLCKQVLRCGALIKSVTPESYQRMVTMVRKAVLLPELPRPLQARLLNTFEELLLEKPVDPETAMFYSTVVGD